jgi:hypothetical protein
MEENAPELEGVSTTAGANELANVATDRACKIVANCNRFKQPRLDRIALYRDLYAGKVKKKFRQPFNVTLPVFSGAMDTLAADFNDDLAVDITEVEPADYLAVRKIDALWNQETTSVAPNAKFAYKTRTDRFNALFSGRGFMMNYAQSKPTYRNNFETFELEDAIFLPQGGGIWPMHQAAGRQNVIRSASELRSGDYDQTQVRKLIQYASGQDFHPSGDEHTKNELAKFKAMGLSPESNTYVGEALFRLVELRLTIDGKRWYLLFSPYYNVWVRFAPFSEMFSADIDPWVSWATHEDNKNFLSKSFADDLYGVADAVHTLFNQELINREKQNLNARAYDKEMFPDVAKLDQAQYRPDALVPFDSKGGSRKIGEGLYSFETPQLSGTINLIDWMNETTGRSIGVTDLSQGGVQNVSKKASVVFAEQQSISKRLLLRSSSYTEAMGEIAKIFVQGAKDHLPAKLAIKRLGVEGEAWEPVIRRVDLDLYGDIDIKITSSAVEMRNSQLKKQARKEVLDTVSADPVQAAQVNPRWLVEQKLRSVAEFDDAEIGVAMDTKNYGNKEEVAYAHKGIQAILEGEQPDTFYGATTLFMQIVYDYAVNNRVSLGDRKFHQLLDYQMAHADIVQENMQRKAQQEAAAAPAPQEDPGTPAPAADPMNRNPLQDVRKVAATMS